MKDFRKERRIVYGQSLILLLLILERICGNRSGRQHDLDRHEEAFKANVELLTGCAPECLPHSDTLKRHMEKLPVDELGKVRLKVVRHLLRTKRLYGMRCPLAMLRGRMCFLVAIDGVHWHTTGRAIGHSTHRVRQDGATEYMLTALQASLVSSGGLRIPLMTEFIENPESEYDKQDCELKAAKRLLERLKKEFQHLPVTLLMDGLYLCEDILNVCRRNGWHFSVTVTDHASAFKRKAEAEMEAHGHCVNGTDPGTTFKRSVKWRNGISHTFGETTVKLNVIRMETLNDRGEDVTLFYATSLFLHEKEEKALGVLDGVCRARWQIEEAFKAQKRHGLELEKVFGTRGNAGQNFYHIVQLADIIRTLMMHSGLFRRLQHHFNGDRLKEVIQRPMLEWYVTVANFVERLKRSMLTCVMSDLDISGWRLALDTA